MEYKGHYDVAWNHRVCAANTFSPAMTAVEKSDNGCVTVMLRHSSSIEELHEIYRLSFAGCNNTVLTPGHLLLHNSIYMHTHTHTHTHTHMHTHSQQKKTEYDTRCHPSMLPVHIQCRPLPETGLCARTGEKTRGIPSFENHSFPTFLSQHPPLYSLRSVRYMPLASENCFQSGKLQVQ